MGGGLTTTNPVSRSQQGGGVRMQGTNPMMTNSTFQSFSYIYTPPPTWYLILIQNINFLKKRGTTLKKIVPDTNSKYDLKSVYISE